MCRAGDLIELLLRRRWKIRFQAALGHGPLRKDTQIGVVGFFAHKSRPFRTAYSPGFRGFAEVQSPFFERSKGAIWRSNQLNLHFLSGFYPGGMLSAPPP